MRDISIIIKNYPSISNVFTQEWFEKECKKDKEEMHLLAKQFTFEDKDGSSLDSHSLQYIGYLEILLKNMEDEINFKRKHFVDKLIDKNNYLGALAEIEIGHLFKNMGFKPEFEPSIPGNDRISDIKIVSDDVEVFIEVSTRKGPEITKMGQFKFLLPRIFRDKFENESNQLSKSNPGIIALYLEPSSIPEMGNIIRGFGFDRVWEKNGNIIHIEKGEHIIENSMISAVLLYIRSFNNNKYNVLKKLYLNPKADKQLPNSITKKFDESEIINPKSYNRFFNNLHPSE